MKTFFFPADLPEAPPGRHPWPVWQINHGHFLVSWGSTCWNLLFKHICPASLCVTVCVCVCQDIDRIGDVGVFHGRYCGLLRLFTRWTRRPAERGGKGQTFIRCEKYQLFSRESTQISFCDNKWKIKVLVTSLFSSFLWPTEQHPPEHLREESSHHQHRASALRHHHREPRDAQISAGATELGSSQLRSWGHGGRILRPQSQQRGERRVAWRHQKGNIQPTAALWFRWSASSVSLSWITN